MNNSEKYKVGKTNLPLGDKLCILWSIVGPSGELW
jgi:hypothetical protein